MRKAENTRQNRMDRQGTQAAKNHFEVDSITRHYDFETTAHRSFEISPTLMVSSDNPKRLLALKTDSGQIVGLDFCTNSNGASDV